MKVKLVFLFFLFCLSANAQNGFIRISGKVTDVIDNRITIPGCFVVNMRTQSGILANEDGTFSISVWPTDTLAFRTLGYELKLVYLKDSAVREGYILNISLKRQPYNLGEVTIIPHRTLDSISKDIDKLGYDESEYRLEGYEAIQSPITALYQAFSRKERSKREVAFMMNEDQRRKLLRELLKYYSSAGYLPIVEKEYDPFIDYCAINDAQLKTLTQYEMAVYIKRKYELFKGRR